MLANAAELFRVDPDSLARVLVSCFITTEAGKRASNIVIPLEATNVRQLK